MQMRRFMRGVTLMELMIVVVIIGILAAVAYPNYREFVTRAKRTEARAALLKIATNQEKYYLQNNTFTKDLTKLGLGPDPDTYTTDSGTYAVSIALADASNFTANAVYIPVDAEADKCGRFTIDARGQKTSARELDCWTRTR